ncbi:MAG: T9SS type A sorting domain-containing protein [Bacteroidales bacterium]|nr:T9SS type A sorting domain-containing protein [Bacteroidales bacterium]
MKNTLTILYLLLLINILSNHNVVNGQIIINPGPDISPTDMVENIVGQGIIYDNVTFQGADISSGIFTNGQTTNLGLECGIFLTSGAGYIIPGPNTSTNAGVNNGLPGHPTLTAIATGSTYDAAVLEFDFYPESDTLGIKFVFGSEEYDEFVGTTYGDVCGIFVSGPNPNSGFYVNQNIALVPGTDLPVSINNINNNSFPEYFIDNTNGLTIEYDGFTTVLTAWLLVIPCEEYHLKIGIADVGDHVYDTGVFLEENSITCPKIDVEALLNPLGISENMVEGCVDATISFELPDTTFSPYTLYWNLSESTANPKAFVPDGGDFEEEVPDSIVFEEGVDSIAVQVVPVYDEIVEGEEYLRMIIENTLGCITRHDTVTLFIDDYIGLSDTISPPAVTLQGFEVDLWVNVFNGYPPYSYLWEPGGFATDSITVSPDTTTKYTVTYTDVCQNSGQDSTEVFVFPYAQFSSFSFKTEYNPTLPWDVIGQLQNDTVYLAMPGGIDLSNLVASFNTTSSFISVTVNGVLQESGITPNDFTNPVIYKILSPGGALAEWVVMVDIETGQTENNLEQVSIFPNPAKDEFYIKGAKGYKVVLINNMGKKSKPIEITDDLYLIDMSKFSRGIYYLQFTYGQHWFVERVVVNR